MNRFPAIAMTLAALVITASAAPRVALVRVKDIYSGLPSTAALQEQIQAERQELMKNQRAVDLRRIIGELRTLQARLSDKDHPLDEATNRKLARSYEIKRQEAQTLQKEFESFRSEQEKEINRRMVTGMRDALDRIVATAARVGKEQGFDLVFDSSGNTNTGVEFVLYSKESPDITDTVKAAIQDSEAKPADNKAPKKASKP